MNENLIKDGFDENEPVPDPVLVAMPDLSPHPASSLEWWFVQGHIESDKLGRREFMLSFFRQAGKQKEQDGHMLLVTSLDVATGKHSVLSQVSRKFVENFNLDAPGDIENAGLDEKIANAMLKEMAASGPPRPIQTEEDVASISAKPASIEWQNFSLRQHDDCIEIDFTLPGEALPCRLTAHPHASWFEGRDFGGGEVGKMAYDCCPRLQLSGTVDGENIIGQAWLDHQ
jgi:predicted secreted hydrolase